MKTITLPSARHFSIPPGSIQFAIVIAIITVVIIGSLAVLIRPRR